MNLYTYVFLRRVRLYPFVGTRPEHRLDVDLVDGLHSEAFTSRVFEARNMKRRKDMLIKATIAGGGVIPHIHKSLLEKQRAQGESGPAAPAKSN